MVNVPAVVMAVRDGRAGLLELTVVVASLVTMHTSTKNAVREMLTMCTTVIQMTDSHHNACRRKTQTVGDLLSQAWVPSSQV